MGRRALYAVGMLLPLVVKFPIHWGEMDALGHVNNARFFTWLETARIALLERIGVLADKPRDVGPILATIQCDFLRPVVYPATIVVRAGVTAIGRTSITMAYEIVREDAPAELCARATSVVVLVDYRTMAKVPVSDDIRAAIAAFA